MRLVEAKVTRASESSQLSPAEHAINQAVAISLLEAAGLVVDLAEDGEQAVALAGSRDYDLVLMDVQMPRVDGIEATVAIRRIPARRALPIVAMTANAFAEDRVIALAAGMNDHIGKPVMPEVLYAMVARWLTASRAQ